MAIKVSCSCGNTFELPDSVQSGSHDCPTCQQPMPSKQSPLKGHAASGMRFCRHCEAESPHETGILMRTSFMPQKLSGFWGLLFDCKKITAHRCLKCGNLELFANQAPGFWG